MSDSPGFPAHHDSGAYDEQEPIKYGLPLVLFVLTLISVFWTGAAEADPSLAESLNPRRLLEIWHGWPFALPLMSNARRHRNQRSAPTQQFRLESAAFDSRQSGNLETL